MAVFWVVAPRGLTASIIRAIGPAILEPVTLLARNECKGIQNFIALLVTLVTRVTELLWLYRNPLGRPKPRCESIIKMEYSII
jgi:hypothetical protein